MCRSTIIAVSLLVSSLVLVIGGLAIAGSLDAEVMAIDPHVERACHREIKKRSSFGHRDIQTLNYDLESSSVALAKGSIKAHYAADRWATMKWTCRVHPGSGRILRVDFGWSRGGANRLIAAAGSL
jgi:hypothetical protein